MKGDRGTKWVGDRPSAGFKPPVSAASMLRQQDDESLQIPETLSPGIWEEKQIFPLGTQPVKCHVKWNFLDSIYSTTLWPRLSRCWISVTKQKMWGNTCFSKSLLKAGVRKKYHEKKMNEEKIPVQTPMFPVEQIKMLANQRSGGLFRTCERWMLQSMYEHQISQTNHPSSLLQH